VNEDIQKTFERYKSIENGGKAEPFLPGELERTVHYLNPSH